MTVDEMTAKVANGQRVTWGEVKDILEDHIQYGPITTNGGTVVSFDNCVLSVNAYMEPNGEINIAHCAILYNPVI